MKARKARITLTTGELDVILLMASIATAGGGDGDYAPWSDTEWKDLESLAYKSAELKRRKTAAMKSGR